MYRNRNILDSELNSRVSLEYRNRNRLDSELNSRVSLEYRNRSLTTYS